MITKVEAYRYRCLRDVRQSLRNSQILVGPNGSGKSAFLDAIAFLGDVISRGLSEAVNERSDNFYDLVWGRKEGTFRLAVEAMTTADNGSSPGLAPGDVLRYEIDVKIDTNDAQIVISRENLAVVEKAGARRTHYAREGSRASYFPDGSVEEASGFGLHPGYSGLATMGTWSVETRGLSRLRSLADLLRDGVRTVALDNELLRASAPPGRGTEPLYNGFHLARLAGQLRDSSPEAYRSWLRHVQTAVPDIVDIRMIVRPEDRHRYLMIEYAGGVEVPQWMVSDGTLRLLALTVLAYVQGFSGLYLIEEPEIGLHPTAIATVMQSLSSFYEGQVLITSHSPVVLGLARPGQLLCFQKSTEGASLYPAMNTRS